MWITWSWVSYKGVKRRIFGIDLCNERGGIIGVLE